MGTIWLFTPQTKTQNPPKIGGQVSSIRKNLLILRNPWVTDSVLMGKLYTSMSLALALMTYSDIMNEEYRQVILSGTKELTIYLLTPLLFAPFLAYRIYYIKNLSPIYFNQATRTIHYKRIRKTVTFDWDNTGGGLFKRTEFGGSSFSASYALAFAPRRQDGTLHQKDCLWIDSNEPTDADIKHVAEVWEYLRHFMDHGPGKLPPPGEPNWWYKPLHEICLTPAQAFQHYAPWRTGEPGEMQGKKNWQLPFWAVLFPYNLSVAIGWYIICRVFNVRAAPPPPEAFEETPTQHVRRNRSSVQ
ncbi:MULTISPECIES: hypothetical protein [unclassified Pseudomonas]|uniref:hypothetical protein n=1 Tax=unclassified Pseudomonas TaxID=196821 RepID=UPI00382737AC